MREILFKAKRIDNGKWVEGSLIISFNGECRIISQEPNEFGDDLIEVNNVVDKFTVCQFTGLKDENGVKIFENDILRFTSKREKTYYESTIEWEDGHFMVSERQNNDSFLCVVNDETTEVIGNIHC